MREVLFGKIRSGPVFGNSHRIRESISKHILCLHFIGRGILDSEGSGGGDRELETVWFEYAVSAAPEDLKSSVTQAQRLLTQHTSRTHLQEQVLERATNGRQETSSEGQSLYKKIGAFCAGAQRQDVPRECEIMNRVSLFFSENF